MKDRIKLIRKNAGRTQTQFGEKIGVKGNTVTNYESGLRTPTDAVIRSICREFDVNESWLRTGAGEMFVKKTRDEEMAECLGQLLSGEDESFRKRLIASLIKIPEDDPFWATLQDLVRELSSK